MYRITLFGLLKLGTGMKSYSWLNHWIKVDSRHGDESTLIQCCGPIWQVSAAGTVHKIFHDECCFFLINSYTKNKRLNFFFFFFLYFVNFTKHVNWNIWPNHANVWCLFAHHVWVMSVSRFYYSSFPQLLSDRSARETPLAWQRFNSIGNKT